MSDDNSQLERRSVLKGIVSSAAAAGMIGTASAMPAESATEQSFAGSYETSTDVRAALEDTASDLIEELLADGFLEESDLADLEPTGHQARTDGGEGVRVDAFRESGDIVPRVSAVVQKDDHAVQLLAYPESDSVSRAIIEDEDGARMTSAGTSAYCWHDGYYCDSGCSSEPLQTHAIEVWKCSDGSCVGGDHVDCLHYRYCGHDC